MRQSHKLSKICTPAYRFSGSSFLALLLFLALIHPEARALPGRCEGLFSKDLPIFQAHQAIEEAEQGINAHVLQVKSHHRDIVIKIPHDQVNVDYYDHLAVRAKQALGDLAPAYLGLVKVQRGSELLTAIAFERVEGIFSGDPAVGRVLNQKSLEQLNAAIDRLFAAGMIPLDFQFMVKPDGSIQVIDTDLYLDEGNLVNQDLEFSTMRMGILDYLHWQPKQFAKIHISTEVTHTLPENSMSLYFKIVGLENRILERLKDRLQIVPQQGAYYPY